MNLNVNDEEVVENPDANTLRVVIAHLPVEQFAILSRGEDHYLQTYHNDDGTFALEIRNGSADEHYAITADDLAASDVATMFVNYLENRDDWKTQWTWEKVEFDDDFAGDLTADNAYLLNGQEYPKIPVGDEQAPISTRRGKCAECQAEVGDFHVQGCEQEECPRCHEPLVSCDCE